MKLFFDLICVAVVFQVATVNAALAKDEVSLSALRTKEFSASLTFERKRYERKLYTGDLMSYISDGLKVFALVNTPNIDKPKSGFPVVIFGHGFHPNPKNYGISADGQVSRPGDYYRGIPEHFAEHGFIAVTPDYRGHSSSEGFEFTRTSYLASSYYASDVLHVLAGLPSLQDADLDRIYYLGHSMGGDVGLKVLLASNQFKAASLWAPVAATTDHQALYYGSYYDESHSHEDERADPAAIQRYTNKIDSLYSDLPVVISKDQVDPIHYIKDLSTPIVVHHARGDSSVPYIWSQDLVLKLFQSGKDFRFYSYDGDSHLFEGKNRRLAFERDLQFFSEH
ncbi:MAG: dienelactone hydrolase [Cryomorphaceae bacterium]|jgi:dienelactone hydrolase